MVIFLILCVDVHIRLTPSPPSTCVHIRLTPFPLRVDVINGWPLIKKGKVDLCYNRACEGLSLSRVSVRPPMTIATHSTAFRFDAASARQSVSQSINQKGQPIFQSIC